MKDTKPKTALPKGMRFAEIELENWRNFTQVRQALGRRVFVVGPNASGKSNLLDALKFLRDLVRVGGGLQRAVELRDGMSSIRSLAARSKPKVRIACRVTSEEPKDEWSYELIFDAGKGGNPVVCKEKILRNKDVLLERPDTGDKDDPDRLGQTHLEQTSQNRAFRPLAEFLATLRYMHLVPQLIKHADWYGRIDDDPFGSDFLARVAKTPDRERKARLKRIEKALLVAVPQLKELRSTQDKDGRPHLVAKYEHWRPQGAMQTEKDFSDGTIRLIGLLWSLLEDDTGPLLLEEPELSLHPGLLRHLPAMFERVCSASERQYVISTHAPLLLADPGIGLQEVLLIVPGAEASEVQTMRSFRDVQERLNAGEPLGDIAESKTAPSSAHQLSLF